MSFDRMRMSSLQGLQSLNPFGTGQCLSTMGDNEKALADACLNPFGTGQCLSTNFFRRFGGIRSLNPFGTGQCLSTLQGLQTSLEDLGLNPFGTGQCLSTKIWRRFVLSILVSIPLEQGNVFRHRLVG